MSGLLAVGIPMLCSLLGSLLMGLLYCLLTVTLRANQNVTGLATVSYTHLLLLLLLQCMTAPTRICQMKKVGVPHFSPYGSLRIDWIEGNSLRYIV